MSRRTIQVTERIWNYLIEETLREPPLLAELRAETAELDNPDMQISPVQGRFMALLVELTGARRILELGSFTGYSSLSMALSLPPDGRIVCLDKSAEYTAVARRYWARAGVGERIELRLGEAAAGLAALRAEGRDGGFDLVFIDADKDNEDHYYEEALHLLRRGGLIVVDNALWGGRVADPENTDPTVAAIDRLNRKVRDDERVTMALIPVADGLLLARKR
jgi:predicted O-methyltransferase YrrM